jgi:superfamily II DNA or RNA helicase
MSTYPYSEGLEKAYTFESAFDGEIVCGAIKQGNMLLVPRESVPYAIPENDYRSYIPVSVPVPCTFVPRNEEQQALYLKSLKLLQGGQSHMFEAPTGWGKTVVGGAIAAAVGQRSSW